MQWNGTYQESVFSFANNINTHEGGSHLSGFRSALTRTINNYARKKGILKEKDKNLEGEDIREGLTAVISAKLTDPQFEGQTKTKLGNPGMQGFVASVVNAKLAEFLEENPKEADRIVRKAVDALTRPRRGPQGARHRAQVRDGRHGPAGQARRLHGQGARDRRDLHRRGRLRRRLGQAGPRPFDAGGAAAARQDPQRREVAHRQGAAERRDPGADHRARHRHPRRVRHREAALPQDHPDDGRRRGRRAHPHADPHAAVPRDAGPGRGRPHLHRQAAAVQAHAGQAASATSRRSPSWRTSCSATSSSGSRSPTTRAGRSSSPTCAGSATAACSSSTRAGRARCAPSTATRSCSSSRSRRSSTTQIKTPEELLELLGRDVVETDPFLTELVSAGRGPDPHQGHRAALEPGPHAPPAHVDVHRQRVPPARARARRPRQARRHAAVHRRARQRDRGGGLVRGAAPRGAEPSPARASSCSASRASAR